jgi:hypothetical protein
MDWAVCVWLKRKFPRARQVCHLIDDKRAAGPGEKGRWSNREAVTTRTGGPKSAIGRRLRALTSRVEPRAVDPHATNGLIKRHGDGGGQVFGLVVGDDEVVLETDAAKVEALFGEGPVHGVAVEDAALRVVE